MNVLISLEKFYGFFGKFFSEKMDGKNFWKISLKKIVKKS